MKKPKSKLERAKERLIEDWKRGKYFYLESWPKFRHQLNNLIRLAKQEEREGK